MIPVTYLINDGFPFRIRSDLPSHTTYVLLIYASPSPCSDISPYAFSPLHSEWMRYIYTALLCFTLDLLHAFHFAVMATSILLVTLGQYRASVPLLVPFNC